MGIARRTILALGGMTMLATALRATAQTTSKRPRVAYVWICGEGQSAPYPLFFRDRLAELGWIEGLNFVSEYRDAHENWTELDNIMQELVQSKVDVIVAMCSPEGLSAKKFTNTIPIILAATGDPVRSGLVQTLARPGGNVTGVSGMLLELSAKRVALLHETFPKISQTTVLWNPDRPDSSTEVKVMEDAGASMGIKFQLAAVRTRAELVKRLDTVGQDGTQSMLDVGDNIIMSERRAIVARATQLRIPTIHGDRNGPEAGGFMSYGPNSRDLHRLAAEYVDKILRGAKPSDLPMVQPTKFELVINMKTAKALEVTIPRRVLLQADELIE